jgi:transposase-like protein
MSNVDPKGTTPGLAPGVTAPPKIVSVKCMNPHKTCDSIESTEIKTPAASHVGHRLYRCVKCGWVRSLTVGGPIEL